MNTSRLFHFTGKCLTLDEHSSRRQIIRDSLSSGEIPVDDFIRFCDRHLVLTTVYFKLKKHDLLGPFPSELREHLEFVYTANKERNGALLEQVEEINDTLWKKEIQPVYLKGVAFLLDGMYEDPGERIIGDIDFLVSEANYSEAAAVLKDSGYKYWWLYGDALECQKGSGSEIHFPPLLREDAPAAAELHRLPVYRRYAGSLAADDVLSRKQEITDRKNCFVPCDEDKIVHNFIHSQLVNSGYRLKAVSFRDLYDLYLVSKRLRLEETLPRIRQRDKARGYFLFAAAALELGPALYATDCRKAIRHRTLNELALKYPRLSGMHGKLMKLTGLIFKAYLLRIITAVYRRSSRRHIIRRIKDPRWFKAHALLLKNSFWD